MKRIGNALRASRQGRTTVALHGAAIVVAIVAWYAPVRAQALDSVSAGEVQQGRTLFRGRCARCHGLRGGGGEGPTLARALLPLAPDDATLISVIRFGIPNTGMYGDWTLGPVQAREVAAYVRSLGKVAVSAAPPGDSARGEALFRANGCAQCHGTSAEGTTLGPGLVGVGERRSAPFIRQAIVDPGAALPPGTLFASAGFHAYLPVVAVQHGDTVRGYRVNESTFDILIRDAAGKLHSMNKSRLDKLVKLYGQSPMPSFRAALTDPQLDDLVAFLFELKGPAK